MLVFIIGLIILIIYIWLLRALFIMSKIDRIDKSKSYFYQLLFKIAKKSAVVAIFPILIQIVGIIYLLCISLNHLLHSGSSGG